MKKLTLLMAVSLLPAIAAPIQCAGTPAHPLLTCDWVIDAPLKFELKIASTGPVGAAAFNYIPELLANPLVSPTGHWKIEFEIFSEVGAAPPTGSKVNAKGKVIHTFAPGKPADHFGDNLEGGPFQFNLGIQSNRDPAKSKMSASTGYSWQKHPEHWDRYLGSLDGIKPDDNPFGIKSFELRLVGEHMQSAPEPAGAALLGTGLILAGLVRRVKIVNHANDHRRSHGLVFRILRCHLGPRH